MVTEDTYKEGYLTKNHAGHEFGQAHYMRWFETDGFHVKYFRENNKKQLKGHFDLRNVQGIRQFTHPKPSEIQAAGKEAVMLLIMEEDKKGAKQKDKVMIISFRGDPLKERDEWLRLWCSAIDTRYVDASMKPYFDAALADVLNGRFADQTAISRKRSMLKGEAVTKVLTPRSSASVGQQDSINAQATLTVLDTPRGVDPPKPNAPSLSGYLPSAAPSERIMFSMSTAVPEPYVAAPLPAPEEHTFEITVPLGVRPGDRLQATTPSGTKVKLVVPEGAEPGMLLTFQVPKAKEKKKKRTEEQPPASKHNPPTTDAPTAAQEPVLSKVQARSVPKPIIEVEDAATKLQSSFRGLKTRDARQEAARLQWFHYYLQLKVAEWEEAANLAVTEEELSLVKEAKESGNEEVRRFEWFKYYLTNGDYAKAVELVTTPAESAQVLKAQAMAASRCCACMPNKSVIESERKERFVAAIKRYEWEIAEILAISADELQDVADSQLRKAELCAAVDREDFTLAAQYAISSVEVAMIDAAKAAAAIPPPDPPADPLAAPSTAAEEPATSDETATEPVTKPAAELPLPAPIVADTPSKGSDEEELAACIRGEEEPPASLPAETGAADTFEAAVQRYDWAAAAKLASGAQDEQDLVDSQARVEWLEHYLGEGQFDKAAGLAINEAEIARIASAQIGSS